MARVLAATANFLPTSPLQIASRELSALRWGMPELNDRLADFGYGGAELHWWDKFRHCQDLRTATPEEAQVLGRSVITAHEGWVGTADPIPTADCNFPRRPLSERGSLILFPTGAVSLDRLEELERKIGRDEPMHYVMFPDQAGEMSADAAKTARFPSSSIQPTIDVAAAWGARSNDEFIEELVRRGYTATLASFHMSRLGKVVNGRFGNWQGLVQKLLTQRLVTEVHVEVSRNDFGNVDPKRFEQSEQEARALVENGNLDGTPLGDLIAQLRQSQWTGNAVIEATVPGLSQTFGMITPKLMKELHHGLVAGVKRALPHISWEHFPRPDIQ